MPLPTYTYNEAYRPFFEAAYDILVAHAGAKDDADDKESFVTYYMQVEYPATEYRFCGNLGFGGKFWRNGSFYVSCYPEERTPVRTAAIEKVNNLLAELLVAHASSVPTRVPHAL